MRHHLFSPPKEAPRYRVAVLSKDSAFHRHELLAHYVEPLGALGVPADEIVAVSLAHPPGKVKVIPDAFARDYLDQLLPELLAAGVTHILCTDATYFKVLTKERKAEPHMGYALPVKYEADSFGHMSVVLGINYQQLLYNPTLKERLDLGLGALAQAYNGTGQVLGANIIHTAVHPRTLEEIAWALDQLHAFPALTCDIEAFSLKFWQAGIGSIAFSPNQHNGVSFLCDYRPLAEPNADGHFGEFVPNPEVRALLLRFFLSYKGELIFHGAGYDVKVLVFVLFMKDMLDQAGLLRGLEVLTARWHCTRIISYLALNSTARQEYGLKVLAQEFAGNWAQDEIKDIRKIPPNQLLTYNLVDGLATWYVKNKNHPRMVRDDQERVYRELMLPTQRLLVQTELTGMPMSRQRIQEVKTELSLIQGETIHKIMSHPMIPKVVEWRARKLAQKNFDDRLAKVLPKNKHKVTPNPWEQYVEPFNPNSGPQMIALLYDFLALPVIDQTRTKLPATGAETLEKLMDHELGIPHRELLQAFKDLAGVSKILSTYIPVFEEAVAKSDDGIVWLHGSFNLGVVVSGRLSSSEPNLQNIPANSAYGKLVKTIFMAPPGFIFAGADFNSLEDMISALQTKDPNKLKVYLQGFDGHSLRAVFYWPEEFSHLNPEDPNQVNTLKASDHPLRQLSKAPTFALTYQGTWITLVMNLGWSEEKAKAVEKNYHELYRVSDEYVQGRLKQASRDGYVTLAFGLRLRTPLLKQVVYGPNMPKEAAKEARTAGNALGQSWGQLNNRAAVAFWNRVWAHPEYRTKILPIGLIHDAIYMLIVDDLEVVAWANQALIEEMQWQDDPEIAHDQVKLGAALDVFWPHWGKKVTLPNGASPAQILDLVRKHRHKVLNPDPQEKIAA